MYTYQIHIILCLGQAGDNQSTVGQSTRTVIDHNLIKYACMAANTNKSMEMASSCQLNAVTRLSKK